jgi:hypothetical protein
VLAPERPGHIWLLFIVCDVIFDVLLTISTNLFIGLVSDKFMPADWADAPVSTAVNVIRQAARWRILFCAHHSFAILNSTSR